MRTNFLFTSNLIFLFITFKDHLYPHSVIMGLMQAETLNLSEILSEENREYQAWEKRSKATLEPLFISAAKKLEGIVDDPTQICALLTKQWPKEGRRLREFLPEKFKQMKHAQKEDDTPLDQMDEFLKTISEVMADGADVFGSLYKRYHNSIGIERKDFETQLTEIFEGTGAAPVSKQLDDWKKFSIEMAHAKQESDERTTLQTFFKVLVRIQAFHGTKSDVAKKARLSQKWYKNGIEMDPTIQENFNKLVKWLFPNNPATASEFADWFATCQLMDKQDPDAPKPLPPTRVGQKDRTP